MENKNRAGHAQINARGDCVDLADAGSGRGNENPPALDVGVSIASEVKRLESLVQPIGKNPCDGCDHGWGSIVGYKNGKVESKSCMEECQLLKEYLEKQKEGQPCCP